MLLGRVEHFRYSHLVYTSKCTAFSTFVSNVTSGKSSLRNRFLCGGIMGRITALCRLRASFSYMIVPHGVLQIGDDCGVITCNFNMSEWSVQSNTCPCRFGRRQGHWRFHVLVQGYDMESPRHELCTVFNMIDYVCPFLAARWSYHTSQKLASNQRRFSYPVRRHCELCQTSGRQLT